MPIILHAAWLQLDAPAPGGQLFVWAENLDFSAPDSTSENDATTTAPSGRQRSHKVPSHPTQTAIGQLRSTLAAEVSSVAAHEMQPATSSVWLPSQEGLPLGRRGLFHRGHGSSANGRNGSTPARLQMWQVAGLALAPLPALSFLTHLSNESAAGGRSRSTLRRLRFGNDLLFWSNAAKYVLEVLVGQHYLPSLRTHNASQLEAVWQPALIDSHVETWLERFAKSMPPVCRAYDLPSPADAPGPASLIEHFVATLVDDAARTWATDLAPATTESPALHWLERLLTSQQTVQLAPQPAHQLFQEWRRWTEQLYVTKDTNFRICFQLEEPEFDRSPDGDNEISSESIWTLGYYLQARENPNLMVPASQIWEAPNNSLRFGSRRLDQPQERLLAGLSVASRLFEPIRRSLRTPQPEVALLSTEEAYSFLREIGPLLESSGFGLLLPDGWSDSRLTRLGLRLNLAGERGYPEEGSPDSWNDTADGEASVGSVDVSWELTLGGMPLDQAEFDQLTAMRSPLVRIRDHWVELDPEQVTAAKQFLAGSSRSTQMSLLQAIRLAQSFSDEHALSSESIVGASPIQHEYALSDNAPLADDTQMILPLDTVYVQGWLRQVLERLKDHELPESIMEPTGFVGELRPYQRRGVGWLAYLRQLGLGACLADDMGLGKTVQAIALLLHIRNGQPQTSGNVLHPPALLICPTSVVANWRHEIERFAPGLRGVVHHGPGRLTGDEFHDALRTHDLVITSFGTARRDIDLLSQYRWGDLILDEAQNIKNPSAKQTQAVRRLEANNRIALTGTPVENRLAELWSIFEFLNPGYLDQHERFRQRYIVPIERYNDQQAALALRNMVRPFLLRRLKSDPTIISDLPEKNEMVVYCSLTAEQALLYEQAVEGSLANLGQSEGIRRRGLILGLITKLKQITNHPAHFLKQKGPLSSRSGKLNRLTEMLEEALLAGDQALVFTQFVEMGHLLQQHLRDTLGADVLFLHGGTPAKQRDKMVQHFQSEDGPGVFVLSLRAGGSGLNLTRANHVFHFDRWWNPAVENQATDRAFRIGQTRNVQVHKFVVAGTLEERIHDLLESKRALAESIVGSGEDWLTELDTEQLRQLLALRSEMLEEE